MTEPLPAPSRPVVERRFTSATLTSGVVVATIFFAAALLLEVVRADAVRGDMADLSAVLAGLLDLRPWAWASMGAYALLVTPALGLVVSGWEYARSGDRPTLWLALAVLAVLALSVAVAFLR